MAFIPTVTIEFKSEGNPVKVEQTFETIQDAKKEVRQFTKENGLTRQRGFYGNSKTGVELFTNF